MMVITLMRQHGGRLLLLFSALAVAAHANLGQVDQADCAKLVLPKDQGGFGSVKEACAVDGIGLVCPQMCPNAAIPEFLKDGLLGAFKGGLQTTPDALSMRQHAAPDEIPLEDRSHPSFGGQSAQSSPSPPPPPSGGQSSSGSTSGDGYKIVGDPSLMMRQHINPEEPPPRVFSSEDTPGEFCDQASRPPDVQAPTAAMGWDEIFNSEAMKAAEAAAQAGDMSYLERPSPSADGVEDAAAVVEPVVEEEPPPEPEPEPEIIEKLISSGLDGNFCVDIPGAGQSPDLPLGLALCRTGDAQRWSYPREERYVLNHASRLYLDAGDGSVGTLLVTKPWTGEPNQRWQWDSATKQLKPDVNAEMCVTISGDSVKAGAMLELADCDEGGQQTWAPSDCMDQSLDCPQWEAENQCALNPNFMIGKYEGDGQGTFTPGQCRASCQQCHGKEFESSVNMAPFCRTLSGPLDKAGFGSVEAACLTEGIASLCPDMCEGLPIFTQEMKLQKEKEDAAQAAAAEAAAAEKAAAAAELARAMELERLRENDPSRPRDAPICASLRGPRVIGGYGSAQAACELQMVPAMCPLMCAPESLQAEAEANQEQDPESEPLGPDLDQHTIYNIDYDDFDRVTTFFGGDDGHAATSDAPDCARLLGSDGTPTKFGSTVEACAVHGIAVLCPIACEGLRSERDEEWFKKAAGGTEGSCGARFMQGVDEENARQAAADPSEASGDDFDDLAGWEHMEEGSHQEFADEEHAEWEHYGGRSGGAPPSSCGAQSPAGGGDAGQCGGPSYDASAYEEEEGQAEEGDGLEGYFAASSDEDLATAYEDEEGDQEDEQDAEDEPSSCGCGGGGGHHHHHHDHAGDDEAPAAGGQCSGGGH